jgi:hypothetical protein
LAQSAVKHSFKFADFLYLPEWTEGREEGKIPCPLAQSAVKHSFTALCAKGQGKFADFFIFTGMDLKERRT